MRRRLLALAAMAAVFAPLAAADAIDTHDPATAATAATAPTRPTGATAYERARQRGRPVAVLTRPTVLRASPSTGGRRLAKLTRHTEWGTPTVLAAVGERGKWLRVMATALPNGRSAWIPASAAGIVASPWLIRADLSQRRLTAYSNGHAVRSFRVAIGKPSTPTPTGRFAITDKLSFIGGSAAYGCCAVALTGHQPHIEPGWNGGDRLAIHGTRQTGTIGRAASFGCLRARDEDVRWLIHHAYLGSIVEIRR